MIGPFKFLLKLVVGSLIIDATYFGVRYMYNVYNVYKRKQPAIKPKSKNEELLFFTDQGGGCLSDRTHNSQKCALKDCPVKHEIKVIRMLLSAKSTLDICMYSISHVPLENAIKKLIERKVKVRVVTDENRATRNESTVSRLRSWGAFVVEKSCEPTKGVTFTVSDLHMHHKFAIIDQQTLISGSVNWTNRSFKSNWDHLRISKDLSLVKSFQKEFNFLFDEFEKTTNIQKGSKPVPDLQLVEQLQSTMNIVLFFRREGLDCRPHINKKIPCHRQPHCSFVLFRSLLSLLESASNSLDLCLNQFTLEDFSAAVIKLHQKGVKVRYICDKQMAPGSGSQVGVLINAGVEVRMRALEGAMHNKWFIVDNHVVASGSLNWTMQSFCGNYENVIVSSESEVVDEYSKHFDYMWTHFSPASEVFWGNQVECQ